jgi:hypothetical protein
LNLFQFLKIDRSLLLNLIYLLLADFSAIKNCDAFLWRPLYSMAKFAVPLVNHFSNDVQHGIGTRNIELIIPYLARKSTL